MTMKMTKEEAKKEIFETFFGKGEEGEVFRKVWNFAEVNFDYFYDAPEYYSDPENIDAFKKPSIIALGVELLDFAIDYGSQFKLTRESFTFADSEAIDYKSVVVWLYRWVASDLQSYIDWHNYIQELHHEE